MRARKLPAHARHLHVYATHFPSVETVEARKGGCGAGVVGARPLPRQSGGIPRERNDECRNRITRIVTVSNRNKEEASKGGRSGGSASARRRRNERGGALATSRGSDADSAALVGARKPSLAGARPTLRGAKCWTQGRVEGGGRRAEGGGEERKGDARIPGLGARISARFRFDGSRRAPGTERSSRRDYTA
ncbi:hypothetical protein KM043_006088 [Ampulex compressa]|nr:hypothetical protein KM043_006088 [Ampulex compressa]